MFIFVRFCVPYVQLLQHLDSDFGRQIAVQVGNYKKDRKRYRRNILRNEVFVSIFRQ
jgi:hypothetical protein